jgi:DegV family protein with EDD domain
MANVTVITDSVATLPPRLAEEMGIVVVPERLTLGETAYYDGDLSLEEVVSRIDEGFTTSGPSPGDFLQALTERAGEVGSLIVTVSRELASSTFESAHTAARLQGSPVEVFDSRTAAGAQGLVAAGAAAVAARGESLQAVTEEARYIAERVRLVARLDDLSWLARGGHVPYLAARAGDMVGVRPLVEVRHGRVHAMRPALSVDGASERLLDIWRSSNPGNNARLHIAGLHALGREEAVGLLDTVRSEVVPKTEFIGYFGTVMVVHSGPSLTGIAWWWDTRSR